MPKWTVHLAAVTCLLAAVPARAERAAEGDGRPAAPTRLAPADGETMTHPVPSFRWEPVAHPRATAMGGTRIQVARDRAFREVVDADTLAATVAWYVPDKPLAPGDYWWRVAGVDAQGRPGLWSGARRFAIRAAPEVRIPNDATFETIREAIARAAERAPARVVFEEGTYRLTPDRPQALIDLADVADLEIDGTGARLVLTRPAPLAHLARCRRVVVRGLALDYDPPVYTAGRVASVDATAGAIEADILPGHALPDAHAAYERDRKGLVVTEADGFAVKRGVRLVVAHAGFERLGGRRVRFRFDPPRLARHFAPGDVYVLDPRWQKAAGGTTVCVRGGADVVLYDVTLHGAANECLNSFYADRHALLHVRLVRKEGRALSVNNGGNNHHNARTGPWIEGCLFENTGDDVCHVNGYAMGVVEQPAPDTLVLPLNQPYDQFDTEAALDVCPGDRLRLFNRRAGRLLAERRVVSVERRGGTLRVVLDGPVEGVVTGTGHEAIGSGKVTQVFNADRCCNGFVFRRNVCRRGRRIGVLAKGEGGLIEANRFEHLGGGGVEFWNAPFEGLGARDYVVRDNTIVGCQRLDRRDAGIWCTAFRPGGSKIHHNLLIVGNRIERGGVPAIDLGDARGVVVRDNRIVRPRGEEVPPSRLIHLRNVEDVQVDAPALRQ